MLYSLIQWLKKAGYEIPGMGLWNYITFRAGVAIIISLIISMLFGGKIIKFLQRLQVGETIRDLGLEGQKEKEGTPTMGGVIIIMAIVIPCLLVADLENIYILLMLLATTWMGIIGFTDDYIKVFRKNKEGLSGKFKILGQVVLGLIVALTMLASDDVVVRMDKEAADEMGYEIVDFFEVQDAKGDLNEIAYVKSTLTNVPFFKENNFDYQQLLWFLGDNSKSLVWVIFVPIIIFIVTAVSNAANLTDGIDGLATGVSAIIGGTLMVLAYVSGNVIAADYLNILHLPGSGELVIFSACFLGACIGFLWYNAYPAQIFMGDTGSLTLGGIIAAMAILIRKEWLIPILCGIFLAENLSVVLQVSYFKYTRKKYGEGRRIFKMSPLHHHYQKLGMPEPKIVTRFWIVGILLAVFTILTLKIR
ncbi:phospho-N-acetylmuramoyl-pentapeptide-transferase [Saprospiraceae bacterium]|jgi:phospho-N-acetylmuramoyl-pentapeptide-transferase|nr:phospho-N-acetylmuramoyl-pentapeptide-transferase [Bacteroidota bacterium]MDB4728024.1 phospho-N-acetylmuramoyl-pentapeptide-transferase [Saprospiraceae bacterium]MDF1865124.1 phospho-N-acetylmuramoyl-pentapeptide-transferase [Saprospiraceae bacterium]